MDMEEKYNLLALALQDANARILALESLITALADSTLAGDQRLSTATQAFDRLTNEIESADCDDEFRRIVLEAHERLAGGLYGASLNTDNPPAAP